MIVLEEVESLTQVVPPRAPSSGEDVNTEQVRTQLFSIICLACVLISGRPESKLWGI